MIWVGVRGVFSLTLLIIWQWLRHYDRFGTVSCTVLQVQVILRFSFSTVTTEKQWERFLFICYSSQPTECDRVCMLSPLDDHWYLRGFSALISVSRALHTGSGQRTHAPALFEDFPHKTRSTNTSTPNKAQCPVPRWTHTAGGTRIQPYVHLLAARLSGKEG